MTLSKKKSRIIKVENEVFRWVISPDSGYMVLVAENSETKGGKINVYIDMYVNNSVYKNFDKENLELKIIKPKDVALIISQAIKQGWESKKTGKPVIFDLQGEILIKRE